MQAPLLCEIAAHLAQNCPRGKEVARTYIDMTASWADHFKQAHQDPGRMASKDVIYQQGLLQTKAAIAHCCGVLCLSWASPGGSENASAAALSTKDAAALCLHRTQAYLRTFQDGSNKLQARLSTLTDQASQVLSSLIHALDMAAQLHAPEVLTPAVKTVFSSLPFDVQWQASDYVGCYTAMAQGQVYSINLLTGCVLCNGMAPGHLPHDIVQHPAYVEVFGEDVLEVEHLVGEQQGMCRTLQSYGGHKYTFHLQGEDLHVAEFPVEPKSGEPQLELELELLNCGFPAGCLFQMELAFVLPVPCRTMLAT